MSDAPFVVVAGSGRLLHGALPVQSGRVASRRILKAPGARIVRLALDAGQTLTEHTAAVPVLVQVLSGRVIVDVADESTELTSGAIIYISAQTPHSVEAVDEAHLTLTLLDGFDAVQLGEASPQKREKPASVSAASAASGGLRAPAAAAAAGVAPAGGSTLANNVVLASSGADAAAVDAFTRGHAELSGALATYSSHVLEAAASGDGAALAEARDSLQGWARRVLVAQLAVEAGALYPTADDADGGELVGVLRGLLDRIGALLDDASTQTDAAELAASAVSLRVTVDRLLRTERERLLPLLAGSPRHSLAALWAEVDHRTPDAGAGDRDDAPDATAQAAAAAVCKCGVLTEASMPELDVRTVPHAIRHATVFGALDAIRPGDGLVLIASHDPLPLLAQIEQRTPNRFGVSYLERGPEDWRLQFVHRSATVA